MTEEFDPTPYVRPPQMDVAGAVGLSIALITAMPRNAPADVRSAARALRHRVVALQDSWSRSDSNGTTEDKRPADIAVDTAWSALEGRLEQYARLPAEQYMLAPRASELLVLLSLSSLDWLKLPYMQEWAESEKRLARIDQEGLARDIDRIAGAEFLAEIRRTHAEYGKVLGVTRSKNAAAPVSLVDPLGAVRAAMSRYTLKIAALADHEDPASVTMVRNALRPIDEFRANVRKAPGAGTPPAATPSTPVPDVAHDEKKP